MESNDYFKIGEIEEYLYSQIHHESHNQNHSRKPSSMSSSMSTPQNRHSPNRLNQQRSGRYWQSKQVNNKRNNLQNFTVNELPPNNRFPPFRDESERYNVSNRNNNYGSNIEVTYHTQKSQQNRKSQNNSNNGRGEGGGYRDDDKPNKLFNPFSAANQAKLQRMNKMKQKKARANQARMKLAPPPGVSNRSRPGGQTQNKRIIFEVLDDDNDDDNFGPRVPSPQPSTSNQFKLPAAPVNSQSKQRVVSMVDKTSGNMDVMIKGSDPNFSDDDVIEIPVPAPEVVTLDDSDEESAKTAEKEPNIPTPRCISPSNSSMMSDDFIERRDRNRLSDLSKDTFYWGGQDDSLEPLPTLCNTAQASHNALSVSSSSESTSVGVNDNNEPAQNLGPILRGEAVERNYNKTSSKRDRTSSQHLSFSTDNFTEENFMETLSNLIQHDSDEDDKPEHPVDERPPALEEDQADNNEPLNRSKSPEDTDIFLNVITDKPQDIRQAMPDAGEQSFKPKGPEIGWNEEMRRFYNESWGGEEFNMQNLLFSMSRKFILTIES